MRCVSVPPALIMGLTCALSLVLDAQVRAQTRAVPDGLLLQDAHGKLVGRMIESELVALKLNQRIVFLGVTVDKLWNPHFDNRLVFDQPNCQGSAYNTAPNSLALAAMIGPNQTVYLSDLSVAPVALNYQSVFLSSTPRIEGCRNEAELAPSAVPAKANINLSRQFTGPFKIVEESNLASAMDRSITIGSGLGILLLAGRLRKGSRR